jgi:hypothetical protein
MYDVDKWHSGSTNYYLQVCIIILCFRCSTHSVHLILQFFPIDFSTSNFNIWFQGYRVDAIRMYDLCTIIFVGIEIACNFVINCIYKLYNYLRKLKIKFPYSPVTSFRLCLLYFTNMGEGSVNVL